MMLLEWGVGSLVAVCGLFAVFAIVRVVNFAWHFVPARRSRAIIFVIYVVGVLVTGWIIGQAIFGGDL